MPPPAPASVTAAAADLVFVTGPSGAGRTTAIHALEDLGFEAIDNMPLSLTRALLEAPDARRPLALGIDVRNRDFGVDAALAVADRWRDDPDREARLLYLDCAPDTLVARFSATKRRHPLAPMGEVDRGVAQERELLAPLLARADRVIDTTALSPHDLKAELARHFAPDGAELALSVQSFSYKRGLPPGLDIALDCRFLRNPHWVPELRDLTGRDPAVAAHVAADPAHDAFFARTRDLLLELLPAYRAEGRAHLAVGFGCTGGRHRSVAVAERMAGALAAAGWRVSTRHRELDRAGRGPARGIA